MAAYRPTDWHVLDLDRDPVPGDPRRVRKLAASLHDFADDVAQVLRDIKGMAGEDAILSWAGKTADSFIEEFQEAPGKLKKLKKSYDLAGDALASYWPDLESAQDKADKALRDARTARADLASAHSALGTANEGVRTADAKADSYDPDKNHGRDIPKPDEAEVRRATRNATHARERQQAAQGRVEDAQSALEAAKKLAEQARGLRQEAARRTVKKIEDASDAGIPNRHWWEEAVDWVADHWDEIVTVCKWVVTIVGLIVMIVGGPLGWLVFAAALVVMADTIRKVINGEAGWGDLIWAALDCIPATKGFTSLARLGKLWKAGGLRALGGGALHGIGGGLKNVAATIRKGGEGLKHLRVGLRDAVRARRGFQTSHLPAAGRGAKLLESISESRLTRDADGLIVKVDGQKVGTYLRHVTDLRVSDYRGLVEAGAMSKKETSCVGVGIDRRTGGVYEGINGSRKEVIDTEVLHPVMADRQEALLTNGPYADADGALTRERPHPDLATRHAEVKAANAALNDRAAVGLPDGPEALNEIAMQTYFPHMGGGKDAPFCANCNFMLDGVDSFAGRHPVFPPDDSRLMPGIDY
ncbi:putative T7SS-secreted protein [Streptomyces sp. NPDC049954]|uniref:putative T7SS-secreted protein n=1 Tax=Streptomyces sp. NPDC049954 TaxID=3155779 RepID=UPI0034267674